MSAVQKERPKATSTAIYAPPDPFVTFTQIGPRSLQEEFINDALFAVCVLFYSAVVWKTIAWLPIATHGVASSIAALLITIVGSIKKKTRKSCEGLAVAVGVCGSVTVLVDLVFIVQLISKYTDAGTDEPHGFLSGIDPSPIEFAFHLAVYVLSFGMGVYRIYRSGGELGTDSGFVGIGGSFAAVLVYETWLFDVGSRIALSNNFDAHPWVMLAFLCTTVFDAITHFIIPDQWGAQTVWMLITVVLALEYIVLVGNVSLFFGTESLAEGGSRAPGWTHKYPGLFAKGEGVYLVAVLVASQACRCAAAAPKRKRIHTGEWRTAATGGEADTLATATKLGLFMSSMVFAPICNIAIIMQGESAAVSRFILLLYTTQLYVRYWIQLGAVHWKLVTSVNIVGLLCDAAVCLEILYLNFVVRDPGAIETIVVLTTASASATVCCLGLVHHIHQRVRMRKSKGS